MRLALTFAMITVVATIGRAQGQPIQPPQPPVRYVERELWIPAPNVFPRGLDSIKVYADKPGRRPLVVLTHGTSRDPIARSRVTPWSQLNQALWFARRGLVAIVVARSGSEGRAGEEAVLRRRVSEQGQGA